MARSSDPDELAVPVFDADADSPGSRAGPGGDPGRRPGRARGVGVAVAVLALLTAGVAIGGILEPPAPSRTPGPTDAPSVRPCVRVATSNAPIFGLRDVGSELGWGGLLGYTHIPAAEAPDKGWQVPVPQPGKDVHQVGSGVPLELYAAGGVCFRYVISEYADATLAAPGPAERRPLVRAAVDPAGPNPTIGTIPDGDWVVRVIAYFETGVAGPDGLVIAEFYFRVRVGPRPHPTPTPEPTPAVTPAVACGPSPAGPNDVELGLAAPGSGAVPGGPDVSSATLVQVPLGESVELSVIGDACARSWNITARGTEDGNSVPIDVVDNPADDPAWTSQNRWVIPASTGTTNIRASLHFGPDIDVVRMWQVVVPGFGVPDTFLVAGDGRRVQALPGCGLAFTLANGYSAADSCGSIGYPDGLALLRVAAWSRVTLEIPGWSITSWYGSCGQIGTDETANQAFLQPDNCYLGGYSVSEAASPPAPAQFLARPGEFITQLGVHANRNGDSYDVTMYGRVAGR